MSSERPIPKKVLNAIQSGDKEALKQYAKEGAMRRKERLVEKANRQAIFDVTITDLKYKLREIDAALAASLRQEGVTPDGDVTHTPALEPDMANDLCALYEEIRLQIASLEEERSKIV